jgi:hypothetical protein
LIKAKEIGKLVETIGGYLDSVDSVLTPEALDSLSLIVKNVTSKGNDFVKGLLLIITKVYILNII